MFARATWLLTALYGMMLFLAGTANQATAAQAEAAASVSTGATVRLPVEDFFANPEFSGAALSPDGRTVAVRLTPAKGRVRLATVDVASMKVRVVAQFDDADVGDFSWVNDQRLVYSVTDREVAKGDVRYGPGLYAVNIDGSAFLQLVSRSNDTRSRNRMRELLPWRTYLKAAIGARTSPMVYVTQPAFDAPGALNHVTLLRLNTLNGSYQTVAPPTRATQGWLLDQNGVPRIAKSVDDNHATIYYQAADGTGWNKLSEFDLYGKTRAAFEPEFFGPNGDFYVRAQHGDKAALYTYDLATQKLGAKPMVTMDDYDFTGGIIATADKVLGVRYEADAYGTTWFDARMQAVQQAVDAQLPNTINNISVPMRAETPFVLVTSASDLQPRMFLLFNTETQAFVLLGKAHADIAAAQMSPKTMLRYAARDGLKIPAYLTLPRGSTGKNLPMVLLVHGGPWVRGGHWEWDADAQFLASRGYAVLEPDYRGSTGYGRKLFMSGWKQWGLKMQDDVADGANWAIAQGIADPRRICIAGASYGGYAALMGLVNDPGLFKCGIDWAGVTDINLLRDGHWTGDSDLSATYKKYGMPLLVGDPDKDAAQLAATSPLRQAARITQPLLLAYGGADTRVPLVHGKKFYNAVKETNPNVEWVVYDEEGHGWALPKNRYDFWNRVEKFLDRNIGH